MLPIGDAGGPVRGPNPGAWARTCARAPWRQKRAVGGGQMALLCGRPAAACARARAARAPALRRSAERGEPDGLGLAAF